LPPGVEIADKRRRLLVVLAQPLVENLGGVVLAHRLAGRSRLFCSLQHAPDEDLVVHRELDRCIEVGAAFLEHLLDSVGLGQRARISVENETVGAVGLIDAFGDDGIDDVVRDELAGVHHRLGLEPDRAPRGDRGAQHVPRRELRYAVFVYESLCLRPLARSRRPKQYQPHRALFPPRSFDFLISPSY
jgi:hypothetical protein